MTTIRFLSKDKMESIHQSSLEVLEKTGIQIMNATALSLLEKNGCNIEDTQVKIPSSLIDESIKKAPSSFKLYSRDGQISHNIGVNNTLFNPGSSAVYFKDRKTGNIRQGVLQDCIELAQIVDNLDHMKAQSTALVPSDVPDSLSGLYRLYIILKHSRKPIITGAFRKEGVIHMKQLLEAVVGGSKELSRRPRSIFDCCPTSPLKWDDIASQHLIHCSTFGIPTTIVPAPLMGATGPVTIQGTLVQSNIEILTGVLISQLANPGAPIIYGGAPGAFDMKYVTPKFSSMETMLTACASSEIGQHYGIPTQSYLGTSDAKTVDYQSGFESGTGLVLGALSGINVISGPGMLAQLNCQSLEKLIIDNELCGSACRFARGLDFEDFEVVTELISEVGSSGDYLKQKHTSRKLRSEHFMPSSIICRLTQDSWIKDGSKATLDRAKEKVDSILKEHISEQPEHIDELEKTFREIKKKYNTAVR